MTSPVTGSFISTTVTWLVAFLVGASISRLLTVDRFPPFPALRERWEAHMKRHIDYLLDRAAATLGVTGATALDRRAHTRLRILEQAATEPGVPWWVRGARRRRARVCASFAVTLERCESWADMVSCAWCLPFWVFLTVGGGTWWLHFDAVGSPVAPVAFALASRWLYGLLASR